MAVDNTRRIDLGHRSIIPGILDTHAHAVEVGLFLKNLFCNGIPSIKDLVDAVAEKIAALPKGEWLHGRMLDRNPVQRKSHAHALGIWIPVSPGNIPW